MQGHTREKITPTRTDQNEWIFLYFLKEDKMLAVQKLMITRNGDWGNLIQKMQYTFQCITSTKNSLKKNTAY